MGFVGFKSISDLIISVTGLYSKPAFFLNVILTSMISVMTFATEWIWPDEKALYVFFAALVVDWVLGMIRGVKSETGFQTNLAARFFPKLAIYCIILSGINVTFGQQSGIATVFFSGIMGITLISIIKNAAMLGYFKGDVAIFLEKYVDSHKNKKSNS